MKIDKYANLKKQEWYDREWSMTPQLWRLLEECYNTDKLIKKFNLTHWGEGDFRDEK